jgi:hypothetical protein
MTNMDELTEAAEHLVEYHAAQMSGDMTLMRVFEFVVLVFDPKSDEYKNAIDAHGQLPDAPRIWIDTPDGGLDAMFFRATGQDQAPYCCSAGARKAGE